MSKLIKGLLGIIVILPATYLALFVVGGFYTLLINFIIDEGPPIGFFFHHFDFFLRLLVISGWFTAGLALMSMIHICANRRLDAETKGLWLFGVLIGNILAVPLYWYLNIWRQKGVLFTGPKQVIGTESR